MLNPRPVKSQSTRGFDCLHRGVYCFCGGLYRPRPSSYDENSAAADGNRDVVHQHARRIRSGIAGELIVFPPSAVLFVIVLSFLSYIPDSNIGAVMETLAPPSMLYEASRPI